MDKDRWNAPVAKFASFVDFLPASGNGEGGGGGADLFRKGFADLVIGEDPFMVGKIWEKMFAVTYGREPSSRG